MSKRRTHNARQAARPETDAGPRGGVKAGVRSLRGWKWDRRGQLVSAPVRCRREDWYLARARLAPHADLAHATLMTLFERGDVPLTRRCLHLHAPVGNGRPRELLGWFETPAEATHLRLCVPDRALVQQIEEVVFRDVSERDPKCHPLANVPRWGTYQPPFPVRRVVLPAALGRLADLVDWADPQLLRPPATAARLRKAVRGTACVLDPAWVVDLGLTLADIENLADEAWMVIDLETLARLLGAARAARTRVHTHVAPDGLMSARVDYADVPTRGFALQDVMPYGTLDDRGRFVMRVLRANKSWERYADECGFAPLLSSETPWAEEHADVLSAARPVRHGELLATDLPWLVAGCHGPLIAPRIAAHLLRMHLCAPLPDHLQYWNRWDDGDVVVRDLGELPRRYPPLAAVRWAAQDAAVAHLGLALQPTGEPPRRHTLIRTGRIDSLDVHDGLPPEPMAIFMKYLAREVREQTPWARRHLAQQAVTWQFDTAAGLRYAVTYDSAARLDELPTRTIAVRLGGGSAAARDSGDSIRVAMPQDEGLHGDGAFDFQDALTRKLCRLLERPAAR